jgi:Ca2+-binding RTX toxin-like protein
MGRWPVVLAAAAVMAACLWPAPAGSATIDRIHAAELTDPAGVPDAYFGLSVAIDGDTLVVGAPDDGAGVVHVFERDPVTGLWERDQDLRPPSPSVGDEIGTSVAIRGDLIVAGAPGFDSGAVDRGAIHVFVRDTGTGTWAFERTESAGPPLAGRLGTSVAVGDAWVVAGAPAPGEADTGRVHAWRRSDWAPFQLPVVNVDARARLGTSVAIDGILVVAGAPWDGNGGTQRGTALLYRFQSGSWSFYTELSAPVVDHDHFGTSVAIDGTRIAGGAPGKNLTYLNEGVVYLFSPAGGPWDLWRTLVAPESDQEASLGFSVAIEGDEVFAGAPGDDSRAAGGGAVSVFSFETGYRLDEFVDPYGANYDGLGASVAADGGVVVSGAPLDNGAAENAGAAHVFADLPDDLLCMGVAATQVGTPAGDTLTGTSGRDVIRGYGGDDTIIGFGGTDLLCGDAGDDLLLGGPGDDFLLGGDGNDKLRGAAGDDVLLGGAGSDRMLPETGDDWVEGGPGSDIVDYLAAHGPVTADLSAGTSTYSPIGGTAWTHTLVTVEKVDGSRYADTLVGDAKRNVLRGKQGVDQIWGHGGDDDLIGGTGDDDIYGGDGDDLIKGQADDDLLEGEGGADKIRGGNGDDTVRGGDGDDTLFGGLLRHQGVFTNVIDGGAGTDVCRWWFDDPINCD